MSEIRVIITDSAVKDRLHQLENQLIDFCTNVLEMEDVKVELTFNSK